MEIKNWTQYLDRGAYTGVISGVKHSDPSGGQAAHSGDTVSISEEARQAAMAAEMEKDGLSHEAAKALSSGKITVTEPDWDTFQVPTLPVMADRNIYNTAYLDAYTSKLGELTSRVQAYYAPELSSIRDMSTKDALDYLFNTYVKPFTEDLFIEGTDIPPSHNKMTRNEADMAYYQLKSLYLGNGISILRDPYALGADGLDQLDNNEKTAREAAQKVYDAAQKEVDLKQEAWQAEQKEKYKQMYQNLNSKNSTCLGYMALRPNEQC